MQSRLWQGRERFPWRCRSAICDYVGNGRRSWIESPATSRLIGTFFRDNLRSYKLHEWPGGLFAKIRIGESVLAVGEPTNHEWMRPMPAMIYMYVPDADALYDQAIRAGAESIHPPADQPYGDRNGGVTDAWGNQWYIATPL